MADKKIQLLILDIDGVMTDGAIFFDETGRQSRAYHITDGLGIALWRAVGGKTAILTSKRSDSIVARAKMLKIDLVEQGEDDKIPGFERILEATGVTAEQTAYMGDDLLDGPILRRVGYPITVANGVEEVKRIARFVTKRGGGQGAVREAIEHLLHEQDQWSAAVEAIGFDR